MTNELIVVVGPTAIGKTALAIKLAKAFDTSIISADSRQFYKEMTIGTAVPSKDELQAVKHYCVQHISIQDTYSVRDFELESLSILKQLFQVKEKVILVGGSGLFLNAIIKGLDEMPEVNSNIRKALNERLDHDGLEPLAALLRELDVQITYQIDMNNPRRVIRALEVYLSTGRSLSTFKNQSKTPRPFKVKIIGLQADRNQIYQRIEDRVDIMMAQGLMKEAQDLYTFKHLNALQTVGYSELFDYFDGKETLEVALSKIKQNTRRFAKRQMTWFNNQMAVEWFDYRIPAKKILEKLN